MANVNQISEAVILCGGKGTRLRNVVSDVPKPLAPINGTPFLSILMHSLVLQGIKRIILASGYMHQKIEEIYGNSFEEAEIVYSIEQSPLGTGGAIAKALSKAQSENVLVVNGDSIIKFDLNQTALQFDKIKKENPNIKFPTLLTLKPMENVDRYGAVSLSCGRIEAFEEKSFREKCLINAGVYVLCRDVFKTRGTDEVFSFEKDFLEVQVSCKSLYGIVCEGFFIDIGVPEDYAKAQEILTKQFDQ